MTRTLRSDGRCRPASLRQIWPWRLRAYQELGYVVNKLVTDIVSS
jgi:hypothetical protein